MRTIQGKHGVGTEFYVIDLTDEPVKIDFEKQVDDVIVNSPDGDIFIGWDYENPEDFNETNCMLLTVRDNMKEITKERCTHFYCMAKEKGKILRVYITIQR